MSPVRSASLPPVCAGCQCVLNKSSTVSKPLLPRTTFASSLARSGEPLSIAAAAPAVRSTTTLLPAPVIKVAPSRSGSSRSGAALLCARAPRGSPPPTIDADAAPSVVARNCRRSQRAFAMVRILMSNAGLLHGGPESLVTSWATSV